VTATSVTKDAQLDEKPASRRGREVLVVLGILAAGVALFFHQTVLAGRVFYSRDLHLYWATQLEAFVQCLAQGSRPLWNPYVSFGQPMWANPNNQLLYPLTWLNLLISPWRYFTAFTFLHFVFAGLGLYLLVRRLGGTRAAAALGAGVWITSGPFVSLVNLWNHLAGAAWLPWSVLAADRAVGSGRFAHALLWGGTLAATVAAGSPESTVMALVAGSLLACARLPRPTLRTTARQLVVPAAVASFFGLGLSAAQWLPSLELSQRSLRAFLPYDLRTVWSVRPLALLQALNPFIVDAGLLRPEIKAQLFDAQGPYLASLYLGLPVLALILLYRPRVSRLSAALVLMLIGGAAYALGRHSPAHAWFEALLPVLRAFRFPAKGMVLVAFAWSLCAAFACDRWLVDCERERRSGWRQFVLTVFSGTLGLAACVVGWQAEKWGILLATPDRGVASQAQVALRLAGSLAVAAVCVAALAVLSSHRVRVAVIGRGGLLAALFVAELFLAHLHLNPTAPSSLYTQRPAVVDVLRRESAQRTYAINYAEAGVGQRLLGHAGFIAAWDRVPGNPPWIEALAMRSYPYPSTLGFWGLEGAFTLDALALYSREYHALDWFVRHTYGTPAFARILAMAGVTHVVALAPQGLEGLTPVARVDNYLIEPTLVYRVPGALPRAQLVSGVRVADGAPALDVLRDETFDPRREVVLPSGAARLANPVFAGTARISARKPDRVVIATEANADGYLMLTDGYDPNWRVTIDGRPAPLLRANVVFRAVALRGGQHIVEFRYWPRAFVWGWAITGVTLLIAGAIAVRSRRKGQGM
jgi:hypothetical protein